MSDQSFFTGELSPAQQTGQFRPVCQPLLSLSSLLLTVCLSRVSCHQTPRRTLPTDKTSIYSHNTAVPIIEKGFRTECNTEDASGESHGEMHKKHTQTSQEIKAMSHFLLFVLLILYLFCDYCCCLYLLLCI